MRPESYQATHEAADNLVAFHAALSNGNRAGEGIRCRCTRNPASPAVSKKHDQEAMDNFEIFMDCGVGNTRRYVHVNQIYKKLEEACPGSAQAVVAIHALTGSDYTSAFYHKGKLSALNLLLGDESGRFVSYFRSLSCTKIDNIEVAEEFVCRLYGSSISDINKTRANKVRKITGFDKVTVTDANKEKVRDQLDRIDCSMLPPCRKVLTKKMQRVNYMSQLWGNPDKRNPTETLRPSDYSWKDVENGLQPVWYEGSFVPQQVEKTPEAKLMERREDEVWSDDSDVEEG